MQENPDQKNDFEGAASELSRGFEKEKSSAKQALHDAQDTIKEKAASVTREAKDMLLEQTAGRQKDIGASLQAFGGALRAASDHLANSDQRAAASMVLEAAGGLERLSSSLKTKPIEEVLGELRSFGRENSSALMAGSVIAGLALGRFIKSTSSNLPSGPHSARESGEQKASGEAFGSDADFSAFPSDPSKIEQDAGDNSVSSREGSGRD